MCACNYGTETNRLLHDIIVSGIKSDKAYSQCITKGNELTLQECIVICKNVDATDRQMKACSKDKKDTTPTATEVHKLHHNGAYRHNNYNYSTPYFHSASGEANVHVLQTVPVAKLTNQEQGEHIRPLYYSKSLNSTPHEISCEVDTGAGCNVIPLHIAQKLYSDQE